MISSILHCLLGVYFMSRIWSILVRVLWVLENYVYSAAIGGEYSVMEDQILFVDGVTEFFYILAYFLFTCFINQHESDGVSIIVYLSFFCHFCQFILSYFEALFFGIKTQDCSVSWMIDIYFIYVLVSSTIDTCKTRILTVWDQLYVDYFQ